MPYMDPDDRDTLVCDLVTGVLDTDTADAVLHCQAFTALAVNLAKAGGDDELAMRTVLADVWAGVDDDTRAWLVEYATAPAGWLANKVKEA